MQQILPNKGGKILVEGAVLQPEALLLQPVKLEK